VGIKISAEVKITRDDLTNPFWIEDPELKKGEVDFLSSDEELFWKDLLAKYLHPLKTTEQEDVKCPNNHICNE